MDQGQQHYLFYSKQIVKLSDSKREPEPYATSPRWETLPSPKGWTDSRWGCWEWQWAQRQARNNKKEWKIERIQLAQTKAFPKKNCLTAVRDRKRGGGCLIFNHWLQLREEIPSPNYIWPVGCSPSFICTHSELIPQVPQHQRHAQWLVDESSKQEHKLSLFCWEDPLY